MANPKKPHSEAELSIRHDHPPSFAFLVTSAGEIVFPFKNIISLWFFFCVFYFLILFCHSPDYLKMLLYLNLFCGATRLRPSVHWLGSLLMRYTTNKSS